MNRSKCQNFQRRTIPTGAETAPKWSFDHVRTGKALSLVDAPEETVRFLSNVRRKLEWGNAVRVVASDACLVTPDGVAVTIALGRQFGRQLGGELPTHPASATVFKDSGVIGVVGRNAAQASWKVVKSPGQILKTAIGQPEAVVWAALAFVRKAFGMPGFRHQSLVRIMTECMANCDNHSTLGRGDASFNFHAFHDKERDVVCFSFVDGGVGILRSLSVRLGEQFTLLFSPQKILSDAMHGKLRSRTHTRGRGRGLGSIRDAAVNRKTIRRLVVVANNAYFDGSGNTRRLPHTLKGTFIYWEICRSSMMKPAKR